jgi:hypothetical protein
MRRVSIAGLMAVVLVCGLAAAALREASEIWAGILLLVTLGLLAFGLLAVRQRREASRAFWEGFALFGWGYLVLTFGPWFGEQVGPRLPTTQLLGYLHGKLSPPAQEPLATLVLTDGKVNVGGPGQLVTTSASNGDRIVRLWVNGTGTLTSTGLAQLGLGVNRLFVAGPGNLEHFARVGQCLFALLAAWLGGLLSRRLYRTRPAADPAAQSAAEIL